MIIETYCDTGHLGEQEPRAFDRAGRHTEIAAILDRRYGKDHRYFKVRCKHGEVCLLRQDLIALVWELIGTGW